MSNCAFESVLGREMPSVHYERGLPAVVLVFQHGTQFFLPETKMLPSALVHRGESVLEGIKRACVTGLGFRRNQIPPAEWEVLGCLEDEGCDKSHRRVFLIRYKVSAKYRLVPGPGVEGEWFNGAVVMEMLGDMVSDSVFNEPEEERLAA